MAARPSFNMAPVGPPPRPSSPRPRPGTPLPPFPPSRLSPLPASPMFCHGVITAWLAGCLGPSRPVRREEVGLAPRSLEAAREGEKKSAWCPGPSRAEEEGKGHMNCSLSLCLDYTRRFKCPVQMLALTALMSLGTWLQGLPPPCPWPKTLFQPTQCEEGGPAIPSGGEQEWGTQRLARLPTDVAC